MSIQFDTQNPDSYTPHDIIAYYQSSGVMGTVMLAHLPSGAIVLINTVDETHAIDGDASPDMSSYHAWRELLTDNANDLPRAQSLSEFFRRATLLDNHVDEWLDSAAHSLPDGSSFSETLMDTVHEHNRNIPAYFAILEWVHAYDLATNRQGRTRKDTPEQIANYLDMTHGHGSVQDKIDAQKRITKGREYSKLGYSVYASARHMRGTAVRPGS